MQFFLSHFFNDRMERKRIIIATTNNLVSDNRVAKLALTLEKLNFDVWLIGRQWPEGDIPENRSGRFFRFRLWFNKGPLFYISMNIRIFIFLIKHRAHRFVAVDLDTLAACVLAGKLKKTLVVFDSHEYFPEAPELQHRPFKKKIWLALEHLFIKGIYARITVSPGIVKIYKDKYNLDFLLVRNVPMSQKEIPGIRKTSGNPVVYYQGALNLGRGLENSIRAMCLLPNYEMMIVGGGDIADKLKLLVIEMGLTERVTFVGKVPFENLQTYIQKAHVGLCLLENIGLNYYYSLPNRIFDYPLAGLPVIATDFPDIRTVVSEYETGLLLDNLNPANIASAIRQACENAELREHWATTLPKAALQLSWENEINDCLKLFT